MITLALTNRLTLSNPPDSLKDTITHRLTFANPAWIENEKRGRWNGNTEHYLRLYRATEDRLIFPRGFIRQTISMCKQQGIPFELQDQRRTLPTVDFRFTGELRDFQREAVEMMVKRDFGALSAPTGSGKTIMALYLIAARKQPALVVVHTKELLNQWAERIQTFLGISKDEIGIIGNGRKKIGKQITVATVQSLVKVARDVFPHIGHLVIDECHHCPSRTFTDVVTAFDSRYMLGLSATPWRRDGLSRLIFWHVGDVVHEIEKGNLVESGNVVPFEVVTKETRFQSTYDASEEYTKMLSELTKDTDRNRLIVDSIVSNPTPGISLVLSDRKTHCQRLQWLLKKRGIEAEVLTGDRTGKERKGVVERLNSGKVKTLIATGQLVGEGFDCPALSTLFVCTPIKFDGRLIQYLGRVLRPAPGKDKALVFDFIDGRVGVLRAAARDREKTYTAVGGKPAQ
jgi:superfamily II DNA or RNA helicase